MKRDVTINKYLKEIDKLFPDMSIKDNSVAYFVLGDIYDSAFEDGQATRSDVDHDESYSEGHKEGYDEGYSDGEDAHEDDYDKGYREGYEDGYEEGQSGVDSE